MTSHGSVTGWLGRVQQGDAAAATPLWQRYFHRLVGLARAALQGAPRRAADEEDVALGAFDSFCRGAEQGRFPDLRDRDSLWRFLVVLTARKAAHLKRDERRQKRGGGRILDQGAAFPATAVDEEQADLEGIVSEEPTPAFAAQVGEECERLLRRLEEVGLRSLAVWKMEGYTNQEIATRLGCCVSTVERKLQVIRRVLGEEQARDVEGQEVL